MVSCKIPRDIYSDRTFNGLSQSAIWQHHGYGINCKLSGAVLGVSDIDGAVPIIHGPQGCSFHQRVMPMKYSNPFCDIPCTNLDENDVIYGGERKLKEKIREVYTRHHPGLMVILPTCISGIIGENLEGIIQDIKVEIPCNIVNTPSEGFAHRSKESLEGLVQLFIASWNDPLKPPEYELNGCGHQDLVVALVNQLMEEQEVHENSINIETHMPFERRSRRDVEDLRRIFGDIGISINMTILSGTVDDIKRAPAAELNVVTGNIQAANAMKDKFGTNYIRTWFTSLGFNGVEDLIMGVASKFSLEGEAECIIKREKEKTLKELSGYEKILGDHKFALSMSGIFMSPYAVQTYIRDIGIPLKYLIINTQMLRTMMVSQKTIEMMIKGMEEKINKLGIDIEIIIDPSNSDMSKISKNVDCIISDRFNPYLYAKDTSLDIIDISALNHLLYRAGFRGVAEFGRCLVDKLGRREPNKGDLARRPIISRIEYDKKYYPAIEGIGDTSRTVWGDMWCLESKPAGCE